MKLKYLYLPLLSFSLLACSETESHNDEVESIEQDTTTVQEVVEEIIEEESIIDFSKFEHYATIESKNDLISMFGEENIANGTSWYGEGSVEKQSSVLTNPDNGHIVKFLWDDENDFKLDWIEASHYKWNENFENMGSQMIETEDGLKLGMSLQDLVAWNEDDIEFSGFGWDFAGGIMRKEGSKISNSKVIIRLMDDQNVKDEKWNFMLGDVPLKSDDPKLKDAPVLVEQFTLFVSEEE